MPHPNLQNLRRAVRGGGAPPPPRPAPSPPPKPRPPSPSSNSGPSGCLVVLGVGLVLIFVMGLCVQTGKRNVNNGTTNVAQTYRTGYVNTINLNLRNGPGSSYSVITTLPQNTQIIYLNQSQNNDGTVWVKVRAGSQEGWANQKYLR
jgi:hypothetical protein